DEAAEALPALVEREVAGREVGGFARLHQVELVDLREQPEELALGHDLASRSLVSRRLVRGRELPAWPSQLPERLRTHRPDEGTMGRIAAGVVVAAERGRELAGELRLPLGLRAVPHELRHVLEDERRGEDGRSRARVAHRARPKDARTVGVRCAGTTTAASYSPRRTV